MTVPLLPVTSSHVVTFTGNDDPNILQAREDDTRKTTHLSALGTLERLWTHPMRTAVHMEAARGQLNLISLGKGPTFLKETALVEMPARIRHWQQHISQC